MVKIKDTFYITYTAYDGINAVGALATSKDLINFKKQGIITPQVKYRECEMYISSDSGSQLNSRYHYFYKFFEKIGFVDDHNRMLRDKDVVLFPRKINKQFVMLHRIWPGIQIVKFND